MCYCRKCVCCAGLGEAPVLGLPHKDMPGLKGGANKAFVESCRVTGPDQTLYWYKDGRDITEHYSSSTGQLRYSVEDDLYGVYQCFVESSAGSDFVNFRVLQRGELVSTANHIYPLTNDNLNPPTHTHTHTHTYTCTHPHTHRVCQSS